ncbi:hypothetical protein A2U01_0030882, partial [Trifolium medium]|nr:hypothetical protein [Trifolium medium]
REGSKCFAHPVPHLKSLHLNSDKRKNTMREAIASDLNLFMVLDESFRGLEQWLCGMCMRIRALSRACHHSDGMIRVTLGI